jgi:hypothetical protein
MEVNEEIKDERKILSARKNRSASQLSGIWNWTIIVAVDCSRVGATDNNPEWILP